MLEKIHAKRRGIPLGAREEVFAERDCVVMDVDEERAANIILEKLSPTTTAAYNDIIEMLNAGCAVGSRELRSIFEIHGASAKANVANFRHAVTNGRFTARTGIPMRMMRGINEILYLDARFKEGETDIYTRLTTKK